MVLCVGMWNDKLCRLFLSIVNASSNPKARRLYSLNYVTVQRRVHNTSIVIRRPIVCNFL